MDMFTLFLVDAGIGLLIVVLAIPLIMEKIKPNWLYGFRTKKTLSDEKIWYPANKYSGKAMLIAGLVIVLLSLIVACVAKYTALLSAFNQTIFFIVWVVVLSVPIVAMTVASFLYLRKL